MDEQLTFFSATSSRPEIADLEGLLAGPGRLVRRPGAARVSVLVPAGWRCAALLAALAERELPGEAVLGEDAVPTVRTPFSPELLAVADRWTHGAVQGPPEHWQLSGPRLYCWAVAAGRHDEHGYLLSLGRNEESVVAVGAALHRAGLPGTLLGPRAGGPAYRITGRRRLALLRELVGPAPAGAGPLDWPT